MGRIQRDLVSCILRIGKNIGIKKGKKIQTGVWIQKKCCYISSLDNNFGIDFEQQRFFFFWSKSASYSGSRQCTLLY